MSDPINDIEYGVLQLAPATAVCSICGDVFQVTALTEEPKAGNIDGVFLDETGRRRHICDPEQDEYPADARFVSDADPQQTKMPRIYSVRVGTPVAPPGAIYVGRAVRHRGIAASPWGNPFSTTRSAAPGHRVETVEEAVERFAHEARMKHHLDPSWLEPLRGKDLVCWCWPVRPCHAEVLLMLANDFTQEDVDRIYREMYP